MITGSMAGEGRCKCRPSVICIPVVYATVSAVEGRRKSTHILRRVVPRLQLVAGESACDEHTADNTRLCPDFTALADNETFRRRPTALVVVIVVATGVSLEYVDGTLACHEPALVFACDASTCVDLATYPWEPTSKSLLRGARMAEEECGRRMW